MEKNMVSTLNHEALSLITKLHLFFQVRQSTSITGNTLTACFFQAIAGVSLFFTISIVMNQTRFDKFLLGFVCRCLLSITSGIDYPLRGAACSTDINRISNSYSKDTNSTNNHRSTMTSITATAAAIVAATAAAKAAAKAAVKAAATAVVTP